MTTTEMSMPETTSADAPPEVSVVVPVRNEADNVAPLAEEIQAALAGRWRFELIFVNDGSADATEAAIGKLKASRPHVRQIKHAKSCGQSAALRTGVMLARGPAIITLDGDGENDPSFMPALLLALEAGRPRVGLVAGQRVGRSETGLRQVQTRVSDAVRAALLRDGTADATCGLKAFDREVFLTLPYFDGMHRFLPALVRREGYHVATVDVIDRKRRHGVSNYGIFDRMRLGVSDVIGVWWLTRRRRRVPQISEMH